MKNLLVSLITTVAVTLPAWAADVTDKLTNVHLCCPGCVQGVEKAIGQVQGATGSANKDDGPVTLTGPDKATVQKAADALLTAGYFGKSSDPAIKVNAKTGAKDEKVKSLTVEGVHLCCGKCVKDLTAALSEVKGVTGNTAAKGAKSFVVNGD